MNKFLKDNSKKIFLTLFLTSSLSADIFSDTQTLSNTLSDYGTPSVKKIIANLKNTNNILDFVFANRSMEDIISDITGDKALMQCVVTGIDLGNIGLDDSVLGKLSQLGGICKVLDLDSIRLGGFDLGDLTKCRGTKLPNVDLNILKAFCGSGTLGGNPQTGGVISNTTDNNPNGWSYSTPITSTSITIDLDGISDGTINGKPVLVEDRKYPSGLSGDKINGTDGGMINKQVAEDPTSAIAQSVKTFDKASLVLSDVALKSIGSADPSAMRLPLTKKDAIDTEDTNANQIQAGTTNFHELIDQIVLKLQPVFMRIEAEQLSEYYKKEKEAFHAYIASNEGLKAHYTASAKAIKLRYASKVFIATSKDTYIDDPSEARASLIDEKQRIGFRYASLLQQYRNTQLKTKMALEIKRNKQFIDIAVRQAYVRASLFREDIAKKELDTMLEAVDTLIK